MSPGTRSTALISRMLLPLSERMTLASSGSYSFSASIASSALRSYGPKKICGQRLEVGRERE